MYNAMNMNVDQALPASSQFQHAGTINDEQLQHQQHQHQQHQQQQHQQQMAAMGIHMQIDSMGNPIYISTTGQPVQPILAAAAAAGFSNTISATSTAMNMGLLATSATSASIMAQPSLPPGTSATTAALSATNHNHTHNHNHNHNHAPEFSAAGSMAVPVPIPAAVPAGVPMPAQQHQFHPHQQQHHQQQQQQQIIGSSAVDATAGIGALAGVAPPLCSPPSLQDQNQPQTYGMINAGTGTANLGYPSSSLGLAPNSTTTTTTTSSSLSSIPVPASMPGTSHPFSSQPPPPPPSSTSSITPSPLAMSSPPVQNPTSSTAATSTVGTSPSSVGTSASGTASGATAVSSAAAAAAAAAAAGIPQAVSAACLACRAKHLKCDGRTPCGRCTSNQSECVYIASRRGYKGPKAKPSASNPHKRRAESDPDDATEAAISISASSAAPSSCPMLLGHNSGVPAAAPAASTTPGSHAQNGAMNSSMASVSPGSISAYGVPSDAGSSFSGAVTPSAPNMQLLRSYDTSHLLLSPTATAAAAAVMGSGTVMNRPINVVKSIPDRCLDSFYHHFFAAHPFVLPKEHLLRVAKDGLINHLLAAMRYIGSLYLNVGPNGASFFEEAWNLCYSPTTHKDGFLVQAMLLIILGLDGSCQRAQARKVLADVERIAVEIGLNTRPFATMHGRGIPVLEESWRRTWWDLFVVDGMIAGVHRETNFELYDVPSNVALPCEEAQYLNGTIPQPMYIEDLENADFSGEDREFSSFAYRILSGRILGRMMRTPPFFGPDDENVGKIETLLTNWRLHLPPNKRDALDRQLQLDEMMFQATMMNRAISIMLHQPFSQLDSSATRNVTSCSDHQPIAAGEDFNSHTRHTISSANDISKMVTQRVSLLSHTHFFTCVVTLSSIVHLSKWALYFVPHDDDDLRQQIRLNIGALNQLSGVWKAASMACGQVRGVAQEIYRSKKTQAELPGFWMGLSQEQVMTSMATDESIMSEINALTDAPLITEEGFPSVEGGH